LGTYLRAI